jgi:hypothetical protein
MRAKQYSLRESQIITETELKMWCMARFNTEVTRTIFFARQCDNAVIDRTPQLRKGSGHLWVESQRE